MMFFHSDKYRNALVERRYIAPQDVQANRIGHFGFFLPEFRQSLWQQALEWMGQRVRQSGWSRQRTA